jgi:hypothetical protein
VFVRVKSLTTIKVNFDNKLLRKGEGVSMFKGGKRAVCELRKSVWVWLTLTLTSKLNNSKVCLKY